MPMALILSHRGLDAPHFLLGIANSEKSRLASDYRGRAGALSKPWDIKKAPGLRRGLLLIRQDRAYRLTWTLVPPPSAPARSAPSPLETTFTQSASLSL
jgi:hypothetical protein